MDIGSRRGYPAAAISNFAPYRFIFDDVECNSMEGLLQAFKFENPEVQKEVCKLVGVKAKYRGKNKNWKRTRTLWWKGKPYNRFRDEYQKLLNRAYRALLTNKKFQKALLATGNAVLTHKMGRRTEQETILTRREFCGILRKLREELKERNLSEFF